MKKLLSLVLVCVLLFGFAGCSEKEAQPLSAYQNKNPEIAGMLSVKDGYIVNENGDRILLRGINLGNWMLMETWMNAITGYSGDWAHYDTLQILNERFGAEKTAEITRVYEENFITEEDIAQIEKLGFNCVRVPFWYRNFVNEDGTWLTENIEDNPGFIRLDWVIEQCGKHGIYVILDMHGAPGGQSMNHSTGKAGRNLLYTDTTAMNTAETLWAAIAERYKDSPVVAAYDLLNEPQNNGGYMGPTAWDAESEEAVRHTNTAYDRLYKAIRNVDNSHMISFEGVWSAAVLPDPTAYGYENMLYQLHLYDTEKGMINYRIKELRKARREWGTAVIVGEFNHFALEEYGCKKYNQYDISYTKWTYKTLNTGDNWGLFNGNIGYVDLRQASYEEILEFFENNLNTADFDFNEEEMRVLIP